MFHLLNMYISVLENNNTVNKPKNRKDYRGYNY